MRNLHSMRDMGNEDQWTVHQTGEGHLLVWTTTIRCTVIVDSHCLLKET